MSTDEGFARKCLTCLNLGQDELSRAEFELAQEDVDMDISDDGDDGDDGRLSGDGCGDIGTPKYCSPPGSERFQTFSIIDKGHQISLTSNDTVAKSNFTFFPVWSCLSIWRVNWLMAANLGATLFITERKETIARETTILEDTSTIL